MRFFLCLFSNFKTWQPTFDTMIASLKGLFNLLDQLYLINDGTRYPASLPSRPKAYVPAIFVFQQDQNKNEQITSRIILLEFKKKIIIPIFNPYFFQFLRSLTRQRMRSRSLASLRSVHLTSPSSRGRRTSARRSEETSHRTQRSTYPHWFQVYIIFVIHLYILVHINMYFRTLQNILYFLNASVKILTPYQESLKKGYFFYDRAIVTEGGG